MLACERAGVHASEHASEQEFETFVAALYVGWLVRLLSCMRDKANSQTGKRASRPALPDKQISVHGDKLTGSHTCKSDANDATKNGIPRTQLSLLRIYVMQRGKHGSRRWKQ